MALNSIAKAADPESGALPMTGAPAAGSPNPGAKSDGAAASPITAEQAQALASALRPNAGVSNPVAEVQAKLRAAMALEAAARPSGFQNTAFVTLTILASALMAALGVVLGLVCVLFGAAMFLFPVSAGTALGGLVITIGALFYFIYTRGVRQKTARPAETLEPLAAGRLNAIWGV